MDYRELEGDPRTDLLNDMALRVRRHQRMVRKSGPVSYKNKASCTTHLYERTPAKTTEPLICAVSRMLGSGYGLDAGIGILPSGELCALLRSMSSGALQRARRF